MCSRSDMMAELAVPTAAASRIATARHISRRLFDQWGLDPNHSVVDSAIVILSELLTDAYRHTENLWGTADIVLCFHDGMLAVSVHVRHSPLPTTLSTPEPYRNLQLVYALAADAKGWTSIRIDPDRAGKTVRVQLPLGSP